MARKNPEPRSANLRNEDMIDAIPRLQARIAELRDVEIRTVQRRDDAKLAALEQKINSTLTDIFGAGTVQYDQFGDIRLDQGIMVVSRSPTPPALIQEGFAKGIESAIKSLQAIVELFEEKISGSGADPITRARRAFSDLDLHPEIARAVTGLFDDGHYANAVEDACKVLDGLVKIRSGRTDQSGTELMQAVFSPKNPVLKFNPLQTESERSEQQGFMFLYAGAMLALRNPRAHEIVQDSAENALEYIAFLSLLARNLDRAAR